MQKFNEERILNMIMSKDIELVKLGAIFLLSMGEQILLDFIDKYGESRPHWDAHESSTPISMKTIMTGISTRNLEKIGVYIMYVSSIGNETRKLYCGHTISVFKGTANPNMPIVDFNSIRIN